MVSVERMIGYSKLESEGRLETGRRYKIHIDGWPNKGVIELNKMNFKYALGSPYVLKSISFRIESFEKVCHIIIA